MVRQLGLAQARHVIKELAAATATRRRVAKGLSLRPAEIERMASAFEHDDIARALAMMGLFIRRPGRIGICSQPVSRRHSPPKTGAGM